MTERTLHWAFAVGYLALLVSGLPLMWPALRGLIRDYTPLMGVRLHLAAALLWMLAPLGVVLLGRRGPLRRTVNELTEFTRHDAAWLARFPQWLVSSREAQARLDQGVGRFNGAQKLDALFVTATSFLLGFSGLMLTPAALHHPRWRPPDGEQP